MEFRRAAVAMGAALAALSTGLAGADSRAAVRPVQRLERESGPTERLDSAHFLITYSPQRLSKGEAETAREQAERAWERCRKQFGSEPAAKVHLDLTPNFVGATGFASTDRPRERGEQPRPLVGIRYSELEYLGLTPEYVLTHEVGHVFSGDLAATSLGEGIADWSAGAFSTIPMRPWWGRALQDGGLWIEPTAFFVTGAFEQTADVDAIIRTAQYAESGLLVQYLVDRFGWRKVSAFAAEYARARGPLESNGARRSALRAQAERGQARRAPDPAQVSAVFQKHFGVGWEKLLADWEEAIRKDPAPEGAPERLVLGEKLYGAVRNWEMWTLQNGGGPSAEVRTLVRGAFTDANHALAAGKLDEAERLYLRARNLVERLKHPSSVA